MKNTSIDWNGKDTFIQKEAIVYDYGIFPSPDVFFSTHSQHMSKLKISYMYILSENNDKNVCKARNNYIDKNE